MRTFLLVLLLLCLGASLKAGQERADNVCWEPVRSSEDYFNALRFCLTFQRGEQLVGEWEAMLIKHGFRPEPPGSSSQWMKADQTGTLKVHGVFQGKGVRASLTFSPVQPMPVAQELLGLLTRRADAIPDYAPRSVRLMRKMDTLSEDCGEEEGYTVLLDGRMTEALWSISCRVR